MIVDPSATDERRYSSIERLAHIQNARAVEEHRQKREDQGRKIGIVLHWLIVKPIQIVAFALYNLQTIVNVVGGTAIAVVFVWLGYWLIKLM
jgi:hypothetical protein